MAKKDFKLRLTALKEIPSSKPTLDWDKVPSHLVDISKYYGGFAGRVGFNPFVYMNKIVVPLTKRYDKGERTQELYDAIMALEKKEPRI